MSKDLTVRVGIVGDHVNWPRWIHDRPHHHPNAFMIDVPPLTSPRYADVAEAILNGLGKDRRLRVAKRNVEIIAAAWLSVTDHTDALIADATVLPDRVLDELITHLTAHGIRPWLIIPSGNYHDLDERGAMVDGLVERYDADLLGPDEVVPAWPPTAPAEPADEPADRWPIVPRVDGIVFRPAVRDLLDPDDAKFVDAYFRNTVAAISTELSAQTPTSKSRQFERNLRARMHDAVSDEELITIVRAAQIAGLLAGFHVAVNPIRLYGACGVVPRRGHIVRDDWWTRLARYPDPDVATIAALHMAEMNLDDIRALTTHDITTDPDGNVTVTGASGTTVTLSGPPATFVRAAVTWRLIGEGPGPIFATHRSESISDKRIGYLARAPMDVGIRHIGPKARRTEPTAARWLANFGITITRATKAS